MALPATTVWEVRTTGDDTNGGGFNASRAGATKTADDNYTYGASYGAISYTDLYSDGATLNKLKSDTRAFVTADVGHIIQLGAGTNRTATLFFEIVSVASGVATLDSNAWSAENSAKDGVGKLGGALASPGKAAGAKIAGNDVWIKAGTYSISSASTNIAGGCVLDSTGGASYANCSKWEGYNASRGDKGTKPLLQATGSISTFTMLSLTGNYLYIDNIAVDGASYTSARGFNLANAAQTVIRCQALNCTNNGFYNFNINAKIYYSEASGCSAKPAFKVDGSPVAFCSAHDNSGVDGFEVSGNTAHFTVSHCVSYGNGGRGFRFTRHHVVHCVAYGNTGAGFSWSAQHGIASNCIAYANGGWGYEFPTGESEVALLMNCAGGRNTSGDSQYCIEEGFESLSDTGVDGPFENPTAGDFRLIRTGAGAQCRAAGIGPVGQTSYPDIGAVQHGDTTVPAVGDVKYGVMFGDDDALMGTFELPDLAQKRRIRSID